MHAVLAWYGNIGAQSLVTYLLALDLEMWNHLRSARAKPAAAACMLRKLICIWLSRAMFPAVTRRFLDAMEGTEMLHSGKIYDTSIQYCARPTCTHRVSLDIQDEGPCLKASALQGPVIRREV